MKIFQILLNLLLSIQSWSYPQPVYSEGLLVVYGGDQLVQANADWHGYSLEPYECGASGISPAMLGRIVWFRTEYSDWEGPCVIVDAVARKHAYDSIYVRQEIAEVSRATAAKLGFEYGDWGYAYFGACPPNADSLMPHPKLYSPPLVWDYPPDDGNKSFYPYPPQQMPVDCGKKLGDWKWPLLMDSQLSTTKRNLSEECLTASLPWAIRLEPCPW